MATEHTISTLNEKVDLLHAFYAERQERQQEALAKAFDAAQLAVQHAKEVTDTKIAALGRNQHDALKWFFGIIAVAIAAALGHFSK